MERSEDRCQAVTTHHATGMTTGPSQIQPGIQLIWLGQTVIRLCIFRRHGRLDPVVEAVSIHFVLFVRWAPALFCVVSLFSLLAKRKSGSGDLRVFSRCFGFSMMCLVYEAKVFHIFCTLFYRFSHRQDRAWSEIGRNRGKKNVVFVCVGQCTAGT